MGFRTFETWIGGTGHKADEVLRQLGEDREKLVEVGELSEQPTRQATLEVGEGMGPVEAVGVRDAESHSQSVSLILCLICFPSSSELLMP